MIKHKCLTKTVDSPFNFTDQNHFFDEHQNRPYGPLEPFLQYGFEHLGWTHLIYEGQLTF